MSGRPDRLRSAALAQGLAAAPTGEPGRGCRRLLLRFFHFSPQQLAALRPGVRLRCYGEVRQGPNSLEIIHPEYRFGRRRRTRRGRGRA